MRFTTIRKGFSLMDWLIVFSVLLAVLAMFRGTVKRAVAGKVRAVGNFMIWDHWPGSSTTELGGETKYWDGAGGSHVRNPEASTDADTAALFKTDKNMQTKSGSTAVMAQNVNQQRGSVTYTSNQTHNVKAVTLGTGKDQEYLFGTQNTASLPVDIDTRH
jgi:hypothetical protein